MQPNCALITVPVAGTPVQLPAFPGGVEALMIKGLASNLGGTVYIGRASNFGRTTGNDLVTDLNGIDVSGIFGAGIGVFPCITGDNSATDIVTFNQTLTYSPPSGYCPW